MTDRTIKPAGLRRRPKYLIALAALVWAVAALAAAPDANAAVTCTLDTAADDLAINLGSDGDYAEVQVDTSTGNVRVVQQGNVACAGGQPTVTNIDTIRVFDTSGGNTGFGISEPQRLTPGATLEQSDPARSEIEVFLFLGAGVDDYVSLYGGDGADNWFLGNGGLNWGDGGGLKDTELYLLNQPDSIKLEGDSGNDSFSAQGQAGGDPGAPYSGAANLRLRGEEGNDTLEGGNGTGTDTLDGGFDADTLRGFNGDDFLNGYRGDDTFVGGAGDDMADYDQFDDPNPAAVTVDLGRTGPQDTGLGTDTLSEMESATGGRLADTLIGSDGPNTLRGGAGTGGDTLRGAGGADFLSGGVLPSILGPDGNDTLDGGPGNDNLNGGSDTDTVTYGQAPAGVAADLTAGTTTGGAGNDTLAQLENLTGSRFADTLTGSAAANAITGGAGGDAISALAGADEVTVRDGEADTASCGADLDTATADQASVDTVDPDCETTSFLAEPDPGPGGAGDTEISFDLSGKAKQRVAERKAVVVRASCPQEDCTVAFAGKVKRVTETLAAGVGERVKVMLKRKRLRKLETAIDEGRKPKVAVRARATDAAGNVASDSLKVRARG